MNLVNEFKMFDGIKTNEDGLNIKFHEKTQDVELLQHFVFCFGWERILSTTLQAKSALSGIINEDHLFGPIFTP